MSADQWPPPDAGDVADRLVPMEVWARNEYDDMTEADTLARAIEILRGVSRRYPDAEAVA